MFAKDIPRSATSYTVGLDKLRQGVTYEFRVVAVNKAGFGEPSRPSTAVSGKPVRTLGGHIKWKRPSQGGLASSWVEELLQIAVGSTGIDPLYYAAPPWDCLLQAEPQTLSHCQGHSTDKVGFPCHIKNPGMVTGTAVSALHR